MAAITYNMQSHLIIAGKLHLKKSGKKTKVSLSSFSGLRELAHQVLFESIYQLFISFSHSGKSPNSNSGATTGGTVNGEKASGDEKAEKEPKKKGKGHHK